MTTMHKKLLSFYDRLHYLCLIMAAYLLIILVFYPTMPYIPIFYVLPFVVFFIIKNLGLARGAYIALVVLALIVFLFLPFLVLPERLSILMAVLTLPVFGHAIGSETDHFPMKGITKVLLVNAVLSGGISIFAVDSRREFLPVALLILAIAVVSQYLSKFSSDYLRLINKNEWRQDKGNLVRFTKRIKKAAYGIIAFGCALTLILVIPEYAEPVSIESSEHSMNEVFDRMTVMTGEVQELESGTEPDAPPRIYDERELLSRSYEEALLNVSGVQRVLITAVAIIVIFSVMFGILSYQRRPKTELFNELDDDIEEEDYIAESIKKAGQRGALNANRIVRAVYKRKVNKHIKQKLHVKNADTAQNISDKINETEDISALNGLYHVARYSKEAVSLGDIKEYMK